MSSLNGQGLFVGALSGLTQTYSLLAKQNTANGGVTLEDLANPSDELQSQLGYNNNFLQYLSSNFQNIDSDGDGKINSSDMNNLMQTMQQKGLTYNEITQLCASGNSGMSSSLMETVLTYFNKIDKNGDGRVTSQEISSFGFESDRQKMDTKYNSFKASSMSTFYVDSGTDAEPSSIIDSMYPDLNKS